MGGSLAKNKDPELTTVYLKILVVGGEKCGKTTIIRRYIANQFITSDEETQQDESQRIDGSSPLAELSTHTLTVPGRKEVVSVTFWEIPSAPLAYMKRDRGQSTDEGVDWYEEMMREAQAWRTDITDHYFGTPGCDVPMTILINEKDSEAAAHAAGSGREGHHSDLEGQGGMTREQLVDRAVSNGFSSCLEVHAHTGDESVLRAVDSVLRLVMEKKNIDQNQTADCAYPTCTRARTVL